MGACVERCIPKAFTFATVGGFFYFGNVYVDLFCREQLRPVLKHINMKSRITIEVDFNNGNQPVLQILKSVNSDDVRDKLVSNFTQQLGGSSWCQIKWDENQPPTDFQRIFISPIKPEDLKNQSEIMLSQYMINYHNPTEKPNDNFRPSNRQDLMSPAEKAITAAMYAIEAIGGCSELLTAAVINLQKARDFVYLHFKNNS